MASLLLFIYIFSPYMVLAFLSHRDPTTSYYTYHLRRDPTFNYITSTRDHATSYDSRFRERLSSTNGGNAESNTFKQLKIAFVTGNQMKVNEVNMILAEHGATRGPQPDTSLVELRILNVDLAEIQEVSTEAIAKHKALQGAQLAGGM
jgi:hypothetical protein